MILLLLMAIISCSSQLIFFLPVLRKKIMIASPFSGAWECCLISFWVYVYFGKWGSVQNTMAEITIHFSFILRVFFLASKSAYFSLEHDFLKSSVCHSAFQVGLPIFNTTSGYFLSSASLPPLLQKTVSGYSLLVLSPSLSPYF